MRNIFFVFSVVILFISCSSDDGGGGQTGDSFDRSSLLKNWGNNIIVPSITNFKSSLDKLNTSVNSFTESPSIGNLETLQKELFEAQKAWQSVAMFDFGKAEDLKYKLFMNSFPIDMETSVSINDSTEDETNIVDNLNAIFKKKIAGSDQFEERTLLINDIDFLLINRADEQGFSALDYLINGLGSNPSEIITYYTTNNNSLNYLAYLKKTIERMVDLTNQVNNYWINNTAAFIDNNGGAATSSFNKILNDYLNYIEQGFRETKVSIPSGKRNGIINKNAVESFYSSENSKILFLEAFKAVKSFYLGESFIDKTNGIGIDDYLIFIKADAFDTKEKINKNLDTSIQEKFKLIDEQVSKLDNDFINQINTDNIQMLKTFDLIQESVLLIKVNAFQSLNVSVDFKDSDGD